MDISRRLRIVVLGYVVRGPLAGPTWHHLQYVLGLRDLGHDVWYLEDSMDYPFCYDPSQGVTAADARYGLAYAARVFSRAGVGERDGRFYDDAINALAVLPKYGSPFLLELKSFEHVQASGLQIARAPGKNVVYLGFALLTAGVFVMFYISHRRLWFWVREGAAGTELVFAGSGNREQREFRHEFDRLVQALDGQLTRP